jgi:hypothetical protein
MACDALYDWGIESFVFLFRKRGASAFGYTNASLFVGLVHKVPNPNYLNT